MSGVASEEEEVVEAEDEENLGEGATTVVADQVTPSDQVSTWPRGHMAAAETDPARARASTRTTRLPLFRK
jgi:hypothetical protein